MVVLVLVRDEEEALEDEAVGCCGTSGQMSFLKASMKAEFMGAAGSTTVVVVLDDEDNEASMVLNAATSSGVF